MDETVNYTFSGQNCDERLQYCLKNLKKLLKKEQFPAKGDDKVKKFLFTVYTSYD